jgi:hypothetical protein
MPTNHASSVEHVGDLHLPTHLDECLRHLGCRFQSLDKHVLRSPSVPSRRELPALFPVDSSITALDSLCQVGVNASYNAEIGMTAVSASLNECHQHRGAGHLSKLINAKSRYS